MFKSCTLGNFCMSPFCASKYYEDMKHFSKWYKNTSPDLGRFGMVFSRNYIRTNASS